MKKFLTVAPSYINSSVHQLIKEKLPFKKEDYENLRNFYAAIVKKHAEQIVFKKIKN